MATTASDPRPSQSVLELAHAMLAQERKVAYVRPFFERSDPDSDPAVRRMRELLGGDPRRARAALCVSEADRLIAEGFQDEVQRRCMRLVDPLVAEGAVVLVEVPGRQDRVGSTALETAAALAQNLGFSVAAHVEDADGGPDELLSRAESVVSDLHRAGAVVGAVLFTGASGVLSEAEAGSSPALGGLAAVRMLPAVLPEDGAAGQKAVRGADAGLASAVEALLGSEQPGTTALRFLHDLAARAASGRRRIVLPEGEDPRILRATSALRRMDVCDLVLLGNRNEVHQLAAAEGVELDGVEVVDPGDCERRERYARRHAVLRAHKGAGLEHSLELMGRRAYFGTIMMVHLGEADGMVSGAAHTTADTIRPALEVVRTDPGVSIVSSVFLMLVANRVLVFGDCAVNPEPTAEHLVDIAYASALTARRFGVEQRVALLSYSSGTSGAGASVDKVRTAVALLREKHPELTVDGPLQYDAAVNPGIAASKYPGSEVAGEATVMVFPSLDAGNIGYKAVQQCSGAVAIGPILQGLDQPINDLSRGCTVQDVVNTVLITAVQAQTRPAVPVRRSEVVGP
ncbi:phosphate acetyltransferase [Nocardiopsis salina]|uniref:phosphate acetyltransferase n=1 Tax=Nocardiopsis salina TaxID=245836 RepID=UPI001EFA00B1|nr:phosphate acetyltransferase [Nocardiopsis salina]